MSENELNIVPGDFNARGVNPRHGQMNLSSVDAKEFENMRETLFELAFSVLHSELEAHRAVLRTRVKWVYADRHTITDPAKWLYEKGLRQSLEIYMSRPPYRKGDIAASPVAPSPNWLSRFVQSLATVVAKKFSLAVLHPAAIFQGDPFQTDDLDAPRRSPKGQNDVNCLRIEPPIPAKNHKYKERDPWSFGPL